MKKPIGNARYKDTVAVFVAKDRRMPRTLLFACCCLLIGSGIALGQDRNSPLPKVGIPAKLEPYADAALVANNARRAMELLATAQLKLDPYPEAVGVNPNRPKQITPECDSGEVRSFNRGYLLAHTGFNIFLLLQELGIPRVDGPHGLPTNRKRNFIQFGRTALLSIWTPDRLRDLLKVRTALRDLPQPIRQDLATFLSKLMEYRQHYVRLKRVRSAALDDLFRREDDAYYWYLTSWKEPTVPATAEALKKIPGGIGYDELSDLLDEQARQVSDVAKTDPGRCFVAHYGPTITFPSEKLEYTNTWIYPTKYLISFWRRRDMEGTGDLAAYVITLALETLRRP